MNFEQRAIQMAATFNVFFCGRELMGDPGSMVAPGIIGWVIIVLLFLTLLTLAVPTVTPATPR